MKKGYWKRYTKSLSNKILRLICIHNYKPVGKRYILFKCYTEYKCSICGKEIYKVRF